MAERKISHSIYLIKKEYVERNEYLQNFESCDQYTVPISENIFARVYLKAVPSKDHNWSKLLPTELSKINWSKYRTRSLYGLILIEVKDRLFALTSGLGRYLLHPFSIESRFGFKAVLNSVNPSTIRQLSKKTLSQNPKTSIEQVSKGVDIGHFGIDGFMDLVSRLKGNSKIKKLGLSLDGEDSLRISVDNDLERLPSLLEDCLTYCELDEYKKYFPDIDNLSQVKDKEQKLLLNTDLETLLNDELDRVAERSELSGDVWASIPEIVFDENFGCFIFENKEKALQKYDIELKDLFQELYLYRDRSRKRDVSISSLKNDQIFIRRVNGTTYPKWRAINCINAVIEKGDEQYFLIEGNWYRASSKYINVLDQKIARIPSANFSFNDWPEKIREGIYLESYPLVSHKKYVVLDQRLIRLKGQSPVEGCDIYTQDKKLIHLKRYGSSLLLGHLFNQGYVSGNLLINSVEFREKFNKKLEDGNNNSKDVSKKLEDGFKIKTVNPSDFTISYVVGTKYPNNMKFPLFSKITLVKAYEELRKKDYNVTLDYCKMTF